VELPQKRAVRCQNCQFEFDYTSVPEVKMGATRCPKCKAIIDQEGNILQKPIDKAWHKCNCPTCKIENWEILVQTETKAEAKCLSCQKTYELFFKEKENLDIYNTIKPLVSISENCPQCNALITFSQVFSKTSREIKCPKCGVRFPLNRKKNFKRTIDRIQLKSKERMLELSKYHRYVDVEDFTEFSKTIFSQETEKLEESEKLTDSDYAVVIRVKNKKSGKIEKIRRFPITDEAKIKRALEELTKTEAQETLTKLGVSVDSVFKKINDREALLKAEKPAEEVPPKPDTAKSDNKISNLKKAIRRTVKQLVEVKKTLATKEEALQKAKQEIETKDGKLKEFEDEALVRARREELGTYADELSDEDLKETKNYELCKAKKEEVEEKVKQHTAKDDTGSIGRKKKDFYAQFREGVDKIAFPNKENKDNQ
jgi:hypothetical protein